MVRLVCVTGRNEVRSLFTLSQSLSVRQMIKCFEPGSDICTVWESSLWVIHTDLQEREHADEGLHFYTYRWLVVSYAVARKMHYASNTGYTQFVCVSLLTLCLCLCLFRDLCFCLDQHKKDI